MFKHYSRVPRNVQPGFFAHEVAARYNFPAGDGHGQTIGIIELGGGYTQSDLDTYSSTLKLPPLNITAVSVDGAKNTPGDPNGADGEVALDVQVIAAIVPRAAIRVYFAPNSDQGFMNAVKQAIADKCNIISISWGGSEKSWSKTTIDQFELIFQQAADAGITVLAAAGDSGADDDSGDGSTDIDVDYPGSSPHVVSCGGSQITGNVEVVWNNLSDGEGAGGGGMSSIFTRPTYQTRDHIDKTYRCVPDVSANASPLSAYKIIVDGQWQTIGGTSACSPLYAALIAKLNQIIGKNIGYANPILYALNQRSFYDITQGNNGYWVSNANFDLSSGLGRLEGKNIIEDIKWVLTNAS